MAKNSQQMYDAYYYSQCSGADYTRSPIWLDFFYGVAEQIVQRLQPKTTLDAGCAMGFLVEGLRLRGVAAFGVDTSEYAIQNAHPDIKPFLWVGSILDPLPQHYDLVTCIEVLEHLPPQQAHLAIKNLCSYTDDIIFSSTPFHYKEVTHFNVRPPEYWAELFALQGFTRDVDFDGDFITTWAIRFRRDARPQPQVLRDYERRFWQLWKEASDLRAILLETRQAVAGNEAQLNELGAQLAAQRIQVEQLQQRQASDQQHLQLQVVASQELERQLAQVTHARQEAQFLLDTILNSRAWRLVTALQQLRLKLAPRGSRRERWLRWLLDLLRPRNAPI